MNVADLLLNADRLHRVDMRLSLIGLDLAAVETVERNPLAPLLFLFRYRLACDGVKHVVPLAGEPLEILRHVDRQVDGRGPSVCLGFLLLPPWIEEFDYGEELAI